MTAQKKSANLAVHSGKLNEQGRDALVGRLQKRADQGLLYKKDREARLKMLLNERKAKKQPPAQPKPAAPALKPEPITRRLKDRKRGVMQPKPAPAKPASPKSYHEMTSNEFQSHKKNQRSDAIDKLNKAGGTYMPPTDSEMSISNRIVLAEKAGFKPKTPEFINAAENWGVHKLYVAAAVKEGKTIPKHVMDEYGDLFQKPAKSAAPAFSLSSGPQFGANGKNAQGVLFSTPTALDRQVSADQAARGKALPGQTSMFDKPAAPSREAALVQKVRGLPGYGVAKASATANRELVGFRMKEKAKPPAPKFSRNGQLAPGRGTERRKESAALLMSLPKESRAAFHYYGKTMMSKQRDVAELNEQISYAHLDLINAQKWPTISSRRKGEEAVPKLASLAAKHRALRKAK